MFGSGDGLLQAVGKLLLPRQMLSQMLSMGQNIRSLHTTLAVWSIMAGAQVGVR